MAELQEGQLTDEKLNPGELNQTQLAELNNLMYLSDITDASKGNEPITVGKYLEGYKDNNYEKINNLPEGVADTSHEDWKKIIDAVADDPKLANMKITSTLEDEKGAQAICISDDNYPDKATVVFRGTGKYEWIDDGEGGYESDTEQQEKAKNWVDSLPEQYTDITASGHSKGGNKSDYVDITTDRVTRSVTFDGEGFSEEFFEKYKEAIEAKKDRMTSICSQGDYVNILLFSAAGTKVYTKSDDSFINRLRTNCNTKTLLNGEFLKGIINAGREHCPTTFLTFDNGMIKFREVTEEDHAMKLLHGYVIYVTKYGKEKDKEYFFKSLMNLLQGEEQKITVGDPPEGFKERWTNLSNAWIDTLNIPENEKATLTQILSDLIANGGLSVSEAKELNKIILDIDEKMDKTSTIFSENSIIRDFSEGARQKLIDTIKDVEGDNPLEYYKWPQWDAIDDFTRSMLLIDFYHNDINKYYEYLIEKNDTSIKYINDIFDTVYKLDNNHSKKMKEQTEKLKDLESDITKLTQSFDLSGINSIMVQK